MSTKKTQKTEDTSKRTGLKWKTPAKALAKFEKALALAKKLVETKKLMEKARNEAWEIVKKTAPKNNGNLECPNNHKYVYENKREPVSLEEAKRILKSILF